jgi:hypothetical protein
MTRHDTEAIRRLIAGQFNSMCRTPNNTGDWKSFAARLRFMGRAQTGAASPSPTPPAAQSLEA